MALYVCGTDSHILDRLLLQVHLPFARPAIGLLILSVYALIHLQAYIYTYVHVSTCVIT